ncbi:MAG: alpha/beta hydrolase, partial [Casimicrobium sp.]
MSALDPDLARYFADLGASFPPLPVDPTPLERRARYWALCGLGKTPLASSVTINDVSLDLEAGKVPVRLFYGHDGADEPVPTIIYFHGGGWVVGDTDTHTPTCARLAHEANALVVSVDYPLAPETNWRTLIDTCFQAASAIAADRVAQDVATPIALAGDSAGGHLATVTAIRARDESNFHVALQALFYPCIEPTYATASYDEFAAGPGLTRTDMQWYWRQFVGNDHAVNDYRIAPSRATSHVGLPPAYMVTAGRDPLRDEGRAYVRTLREARIDVAHDEFDSLPHGFLRMAKYSAAADAAIG